MIFVKYLSTLIPLFLIDLVWLMFIAKNFYAEKLGFLVSKSFNLIPGLSFYPIYALGLFLLVVMPALKSGSWIEALWRGAILGLAAYATYDLTNHATIAKWPIEITIIDILWGMFVSALTSVIAYFIISSFK